MRQFQVSEVFSFKIKFRTDNGNVSGGREYTKVMIRTLDGMLLDADTKLYFSTRWREAAPHVTEKVPLRKNTVKPFYGFY